MPLIEKEKRKISSKFLEEKWTESKKCPICGENSWGIGNWVTETRPYRPEEGKGVYSFIPVGCSNCGYTVFFNAVNLGLEKGMELSAKEALSDE